MKNMTMRAHRSIATSVDIVIQMWYLLSSWLKPDEQKLITEFIYPHEIQQFDGIIDIELSI